MRYLYSRSALVFQAIATMPAITVAMMAVFVFQFLG